VKHAKYDPCVKMAKKSTTDEALHRLLTLAASDNADIRPTLLRAITELYVQKPAHTADEQNQYTELALGLLTGVDAQTRAVIAACLRDHPAAPPEVLRRLTESGTAALRTAGSAHLSSTSGDLMELFFTAGPEERRLILTNLEIAVPTFGMPLRASVDASMRLEEAGMHRDVNELIRVLERSIGVSRSLAERIVNDASGEPLVVAARALGMTADALQRVLLALNPGMGKSITRMLALIRLFEEIPEQVATFMVLLWQRSNERMPPTYEAVHWNDQHRDARSLASPAPHNSGRDRLPQVDRFKIGSR
jgi:uncharacterized protein (DUF2336 family)